MYYTIYKVTNNINGKHYIGKHQTEDLDDGYMGSGNLIKRAIKKHGWENLTKEILHVFQTESEMNAKEKELVIVSEESYNLCEGGRGGFGYVNANGMNINIKFRKVAGQKSGRIHADKMGSDPQYRKVVVDRFLAAIVDANKSTFTGKRHSDETKRIIGEKNKKFSGCDHPHYGSMWITNGIINKKIKKTDPIEIGYRRGRIDGNKKRN